MYSWTGFQWMCGLFSIKKPIYLLFLVYSCLTFRRDLWKHGSNTIPLVLRFRWKRLLGSWGPTLCVFLQNSCTTTIWPSQWGPNPSQCFIAMPLSKACSYRPPNQQLTHPSEYIILGSMSCLIPPSPVFAYLFVWKLVHQKVLHGLPVSYSLVHCNFGVSSHRVQVT